MIDHKRRQDPVMLVFERQLARALFRRKMLGEARRVTEGGKTLGHGSNHALWVMWSKTKINEREQCIEEARRLVDHLCNDEWFTYEGGKP